MNAKIKINLQNLKEIIWPLLAVMLAKSFGWVGSEVAFVMYGAILVFLVMNMKKITIPKIKGLWLYCAFIVIATLNGIFSYHMRYIARDLFYVVPSVLLLIIGYYCAIIYKDKASITKTLVLGGAIISASRFVRMITKISSMSSFEGIREVFDKSVEEVLLVFIILCACMFFNKDENMLFSKRTNWLCFGLMFIQIIFSLVRTMWIGLGIGVILIVILNGYANNKILDAVYRIIWILTVAIVVIFIFFRITPSSVSQEFIDKFSNSMTEINSEQEYNDTNEAMENWRGYEIKAAQEQWKNANLWKELIGEGMGQGTHIDYVPYTWKNIVVENKIPVLHCGYYTILTKGGLLGVAALIWFMLAHIVVGMKYLKRSNIRKELIAMISITVIFMFYTYIISGPVKSSPNFTWAIYIGWISHIINCSNGGREQHKIKLKIR